MAKVGLGVDVGDLPDHASSNDVAMAWCSLAWRAGVTWPTLASLMVIYAGLGRCAEHGAVKPLCRARERRWLWASSSRHNPVCGVAAAPGAADESAPSDPGNVHAIVQAAAGRRWRLARMTGGTVSALRYHTPMDRVCRAMTPYAPRRCDLQATLQAMAGAIARVFEDVGSAAISSMCATLRRGNRACLRAAQRRRSRLQYRKLAPRTVGEMARDLGAGIEGAEAIVTGEYRLGDVRHDIADSSRMRRELNWEPWVDFAEGWPSSRACDEIRGFGPAPGTLALDRSSSLVAPGSLCSFLDRILPAGEPSPPC
ncbi:MAG: hypothetical protein R3D62_03180 [Xanthobacteraceae bacterium]